MKRKLLVIFLSVIAALSTVIFTACGGSSNSKDSSSASQSGGNQGGEFISSNWEVMPENNNPNLKYFGYFHSDGFRTQGSYIEEIATLQNSNVVLINSAFSFTVAKERIELAKSLGFKVIFSVHGFFVGGQIKVANSASLVDNYLDVWAEAQETLGEYVADGTILAFYFDEPAWNGVKEADFRTVTKLIRETYPDTKVLTTMTVYDIGVAKREGYPEINPSYNEFCTDVSYDSYAKWNDETRRLYLEALKSKATNNQYIWGCATGFTDNAEITSEMAAAIKGMYTEAIQEPRYAGILPFSYANGQEGDWGYGLTTFFNNTSAFYDRELRQLYINIGREVCGMEPYDFSKDIEVILYEPYEVYEIGEEIMLPPMGATDGLGNAVNYEAIITSPSGQVLPREDFIATESGNYIITVSAGEGDRRVSKSVAISVRQENEISLFDAEAYLGDASGTDADTWCWPRQIDTTFYRSGTGSLRVTPHAKDGTWPRIVFARNGNQVWDISNVGGISMWVYNPSDTTIQGFALVVADEHNTGEGSVFTIVDIPSKVWTEVKVDIDTIKAISPALDLTKVTIFYGNSAGDYQNRTNFYIDDVMFIEKSEEPEVDDGILDFEKAADIAQITGTVDDVWTWRTSISTAQAHSGTHSLQIDVRSDGGVWPNVIFKNGESDVHDLTKLESITMWVYFDSESAITTLGIKLSNENDSNKTEKLFNIPAREWTKLVLTLNDVNPATDLTKAYVKFSQLGGTYTDRSFIYIDDVCVLLNEGTEEPEEPEDPEEPEVDDGILDFEKATDIDQIAGNADDVWTWRTSISTAQAHSGENSLQIDVRSDGGLWPNVIFKNGESDVYDLTKLESITMWVYFDSESAITTLGIKLSNENDSNKTEKLFNIPAREWTKLVLTLNDVNPVTDLTKAYVKFSQLGGTYTDRSFIYIDDVCVLLNEGTEQPEDPEDPEEPEEPQSNATLAFESAADLAYVGKNVDDVWTWPVSISNEQAHSGSSSLKVTVRQDGAVWPNVVLGTNADETTTSNLTGKTTISMWVYFDSENDMTNFSLKINNGEKVNEVIKGVTLTAKTWTKITITVDEILQGASEIDLTAARICLAQTGGKYEDRSNFYIDDFIIE